MAAGTPPRDGIRIGILRGTAGAATTTQHASTGPQHSYHPGIERRTSMVSRQVTGWLGEVGSSATFTPPGASGVGGGPTFRDSRNQMVTVN